MPEEDRSQNGSEGLEPVGKPAEENAGGEAGGRKTEGVEGRSGDAGPRGASPGGRSRSGRWRGKAGGSSPREGVIPNPKAKLLDQLREVMRVKHYSLRTERSYRDWVRRFVRFHGMKRREDLEPAEDKVELFLSDLAVNRHVAAATQNQAFNALLFLYPDDPGVAGSRGCLDDDD